MCCDVAILFEHLGPISDMAIQSTSHLPIWLTMLCILSFARHSRCSPVSVTADIFPDDIITTKVTTSATSSVNQSFASNTRSTKLGAPVANCATLPGYAEWFQPSEKFDNGDCPKALELFFSDYTKDHDGTKYEFLASGVTPVHGIPTQRVPLKVGYGA